MLNLILLIMLLLLLFIMLAIPLIAFASLYDSMRQLGFSDKEMTIW